MNKVGSIQQKKKLLSEGIKGRRADKNPCDYFNFYLIPLRTIHRSFYIADGGGNEIKSEADAGNRYLSLTYIQNKIGLII